VNPSSLALPHVAQLHAYTPGLQPSEPGWVKLNTNECPYPPSPRVVEALRREIGDDGASLRLYPNPKSTPLRTAVAQLHGLREENVVIGNGSDDILNLLVRAFVGCRAGGGGGPPPRGGALARPPTPRPRPVQRQRGEHPRSAVRRKQPVSPMEIDAGAYGICPWCAGSADLLQRGRGAR